MLTTSGIGVATDNLQPPTTSAFLRLPRELRDQIYDYYFRSDDDLTYDFATNKLKQANGLPIPLSLTLVCRQIYDEVQGLALTLNIITFTTSFTEATREHAALYHAALKLTEQRKLTLVCDLVPQLLSTDMAQVAAKSYPQFAPIINAQFTPIISTWQFLRRLHAFGTPLTSWGEPPSIWRDFINLVLRLIAKDPRFVEQSHVASLSYSDYDYEDDQGLKLVDACTQPWITPSINELEEMRKMIHVDLTSPYYSPTTRYTYSAASSAIRFLRSIPRTTRAAIRNIHVLEDRECVAYPECHGRGFVSFCQENPKLRITHMISLWKNAFPVSLRRKHRYMRGIPALRRPDRDCLPAQGITKSVGTWLMEASILPSFNMPSDSYTLVLDGSPDFEHTSEVFRVVQRDVAWQSALDACYARGLLPAVPWQNRRRRIGYIYEGLPEVVRSLSTNSALIRTNFDPGVPFNIEDLIGEHQGWSWQDWAEGWEEHEPQNYQTKAPLPPWQELRWQYSIL